MFLVFLTYRETSTAENSLDNMISQQMADSRHQIYLATYPNQSCQFPKVIRKGSSNQLIMITGHSNSNFKVEIAQTRQLRVPTINIVAVKMDSSKITLISHSQTV